MLPLHRLPVMLTAMALLLGAIVGGRGAAVLCIDLGGDAAHVALEGAGAGCHAEDAGDAPAVVERHGCVDVVAAPVNLDRPTPTETLRLERPLLAVIPVPAATPIVSAMRGGAGFGRPPPPPHLGPLATLVLRI